MIIEGFTIENWSCIRRVSVANLPPVGVIVFHGPNGTGKSSIVAGLRAALMDFAPTSRHSDLTRWFPQRGGDPRVCVEFRAGGQLYRVTKEFKPGRPSCALEQHEGGHWNVLTRTAAEVHERTQALVGSTKSDRGLYQLLWLPQSVFDLPDEKQLDPSLQSRLRTVLGVMQTPRDDRFIQRVREKLAQWFTAQGRLKENSQLYKDQKLLEDYRATLSATEDEYRQAEHFERLIQQRLAEEALYRLRLEEVRQQVSELEMAYERTRDRRVAWEAAKQQVAAAERELEAARRQHQVRVEAEDRCRETERAAAEAMERWKSAQSALSESQADVERAQDFVAECERKHGQADDRLRRAEAHLRRAELVRQVEAAGADLARAEELDGRVAHYQKRLIDEPAPSDDVWKRITANRKKFDRLMAERQAAAMSFLIDLESGQEGRLSIDHQPAFVVAGSGRYHVGREAELALPGVGRVVVRRGLDAGTIDEVDQNLRQLSNEFTELVTPFGVPLDQANLLEVLQDRRARLAIEAHSIREDEQELRRLAPGGIADLQARVAELRRKLDATPVPDGPAEDVDKVRLDVNEVKRQLEQARERHRQALEGLKRKQEAEAEAKEQFIRTSAKAQAEREALNRQPPVEQLAATVSQTEKALADAQEALKNSALSEEELVAGRRLDEAKTMQKNLEEQISACHRDVAELRGKISMTEGLHQRRAEAEARVEILQRKIDREELESEAYRLLAELFEQCRDRQVATVLQPITRRVHQWMALVGIPGYGDITYNQAFLPTHLRGQQRDLPLEQESVGTREQLAMMVRLALGSVLAGQAGEPAVAVLDDPLTHSDSARLTQMRAVLKSAAEGDSSAQPPAGPLQILVFTCHREWFTAGAARVIDLSNLQILERLY